MFVFHQRNERYRMRSVAVSQGDLHIWTESHSLKMGEGYVPSPGEDEVLIRVLTCGVCRTGISMFCG